MSFILKARDAASKLRTITLGRFPDMSLKEAREAATRSRLDLKAGKDINAEKKAARVAVQGGGDEPPLADLAVEYEARFAPSKKSWQQRGPRSTRSGARQVIERVYADLLPRVVTTITEEDFANAALNYQRVKPVEGGKTTANGQASRGRAYLAPVLDWAAGRKSFAKIGASRIPRLAVVGRCDRLETALSESLAKAKAAEER